MALDTSWIDLNDEQSRVLGRLDRLAQEKIAPRAAGYDRDFAYPTDDIADIHREGWLMCTARESYGGMGYGLHGRDALVFFMMIEAIARVNASTAHCFQTHLNTVHMVDQMATPDQAQRFLAPTREKGLMIVGAGSEPGGGRQGTMARSVQGGFVVSGQKHYITNGTHCDWMWILARHEETDKDLMVMMRAADEGVRIDADFWRPTGMRACVSPMLYMTDVFVPEENILGRPGQFFDDKWLAKINLGFTANYIGGLRSIHDLVLDYVSKRKRVDDQVYQVALGEMQARIHASQMLLYTAIRTTREDEERGMLLSNEAKWMAVESLSRFIYLSGQVAGSTALFVDHPLERVIRDMQVHMLHRRHHIGIQIVGQADLGYDFDLNMS